MPVYNAEPYLEQALDSVLAQTLTDLEIVCVNDGSEDTSLETMQRYASNDARIKVINKPNGGYGNAMNVGISNATGEYMGILEPDDYLKPEMFEKLYNRAIQDDLDFVRSDYYRLTTDEKGVDHLETHLQQEFLLQQGAQSADQRRSVQHSHGKLDRHL